MGSWGYAFVCNYEEYSDQCSGARGFVCVDFPIYTNNTITQKGGLFDLEKELKGLIIIERSLFIW